MSPVLSCNDNAFVTSIEIVDQFYFPKVVIFIQLNRFFLKLCSGKPCSAVCYQELSEEYWCARYFTIIRIGNGEVMYQEHVHLEIGHLN